MYPPRDVFRGTSVMRWWENASNSSRGPRRDLQPEREFARKRDHASECECVKLSECRTRVYARSKSCRSFLPSFHPFGVASLPRTILPFPLRQRQRDVFVNRGTGIDAATRISSEYSTRLGSRGWCSRNLDGRLISLIEKLGPP